MQASVREGHLTLLKFLPVALPDSFQVICPACLACLPLRPCLPVACAMLPMSGQA